MPSIEIIAGPCAIQDRPQMRQVVTWALDNGIKMTRGCFDKPRAHPGVFTGLGIDEAVPIMQEALSGTGLGHASEIIRPGDVERVAQLMQQTPDIALLTWIGAKTGPSNVIGPIGEEIAELMPEDTELMVKNQMESNEDSWIGRIEWAQSTMGKRVSACHRGFSPSAEVAQTQRNQEDLEMTARVKDKMKVSMTLDPSHIAGKSAENVVRVTRKIIEAHNRHFDQTGNLLVDRFLLEVSPDPSNARSDRDQQLPFAMASALIAEIRRTINMGGTI